eukprot:gene26897-32504_t
MADRLLELPKTNVRRIMKLNDEDAVIATAKATEMFIASLSEAALKEAQAAGRKTIKVEDIFTAIANNQIKFEFLNGAFVDYSDEQKA